MWIRVNGWQSNMRNPSSSTKCRYVEKGKQTPLVSDVHITKLVSVVITSPRSGCLYRGTGLSYNDDKQPPHISDVRISKLVLVVITSPRSGCLYRGTGLSYNWTISQIKREFPKVCFLTKLLTSARWRDAI